MFDLIGYWAAVTFFVGMILVWVLPLSVLIIDWLISLITNGDYKGFIKDKYGNFNLALNLDNLDNLGYHFLASVLCIFSLATTAVILSFSLGRGTTLEAVNSLALSTTPIFSYLSILALSWFTFLFIGRFVYSLFKDIKALKAKVATQDSKPNE